MKNKKITPRRGVSKKCTNKEGITLIALVVTIIVLLILAGVTLSLIAGSDGILGKATMAVDKNEIAMIKERVELKIAEDVEKFHEEKYVDYSIDNSMVAYEYLKNNTDKTIKKGEEEYTIIYTDSTDSNKPDDNKIQVNYVQKGTQLSITGKISQTGVIVWDEDVQISGGGGSGTGGSEEGKEDIPLAITEPTWNGTEATVIISGKKEGSQLQYKIGDTGEWQNIESGQSVTVPAGTTLEAGLFDGTERETISKTANLTYTLAYNGNGATGGTMTNSSHTYGTAKNLTTNGFSKDGYTFKGWNTKADGTGQAYADGESVTNLSSTNGETVTLYAQWEGTLMFSNISAENYGDYVELGTNLIVDDNIELEDGTIPRTDWRIFYKDNSGGIYLILADFLPHSYETIVVLLQR